MVAQDFNNTQSAACEKICIQTKKVFDACIKQITNEGTSIILTTANPPNPTLPLTFVSGRSITTKGIITNLTVTKLPDKPRYGRVECDVTVPIEIKYTDANKVAGSGIGTLVTHCDVVLFIPEASIMPYQVEAVVSCVCPEGDFSGTAIIDNETVFTFDVDACLSIILKIIIEVEIIIPAYGYAVIPPCQEFKQEVCSGFFELPLFPGAR